MAVHIRWIIRRDMPEVLAIEDKAFERHAWTEEEFAQVMRNRNVIGMVAEHGESIVGYMIYELHRDRLHILNFAVHYEYRRQGVGRQMVQKLASKLNPSPDRRHKFVLEVRESNLDAQLFFRAMGMRAVSSLPNFYADAPNEDAYVFEYRLVPAPPVKVRVSQ
jgi:ribosomal-protein-alanine N-acetyltransferase